MAEKLSFGTPTRVKPGLQNRKAKAKNTYFSNDEESVKVLRPSNMSKPKLPMSSLLTSAVAPRVAALAKVLVENPSVFPNILAKKATYGYPQLRQTRQCILSHRDISSHGQTQKPTEGNS